MVGIVAHVAAALFCSIPAWLRWDGRVSLAFVGVAVPTALVPDVDLLLPGIAHHGLTHTVAFVATVALVGGAAVAVTAEPLLTRWWIEDEGCLPARPTIYAFATAALFVGGLSHLAADLLAPPTIAPPIEPLWPVLADPVPLGPLREFADPAWAVAALAVALSAHVGLFLVDRR